MMGNCGGQGVRLRSSYRHIILVDQMEMGIQCLLLQQFQGKFSIGGMGPSGTDADPETARL